MYTQHMHATNLDTAVLDVIVAVLRDPFGHKALAMVLPDGFSRHDARGWLKGSENVCSKGSGGDDVDDKQCEGMYVPERKCAPSPFFCWSPLNA